MKKILIVFVLMLSSSAYAADWFGIIENMYLDLDTITFNQRKKQVSFWTKNIINKDYPEKINGQKVDFVTTKYRIDCKNRKYKNESFYAYNTEGNEIMGTNEPTNWQQIVPGTKMDGNHMLMCRLLEVNPKVEIFDKNTCIHRFVEE